jgi:TP901 family phage tail tape measure protein
VAESFLPPVVVELGAEDTGAVRAIEQLIAALARVPEAAQAAADAFKLVADSAVEMADGILEPLDAAKVSIRGVSAAMRAMGTAAAGMDEAAAPAMDGVAAAVEEMAAAVEASAGAAASSIAALGTELGALGTEARAAAVEVTASAEESAAASKGAADAAEASAGRQDAALGETAGALGKYAAGLAAAGFGVFEAIKGAVGFNAELAKMNTQAGVSKSELGSLGQGVLSLAGQVGQSPDSLAEALYHVESSFASTGITGANALNILKTAAEGASIGHANLVDVQNALDAAIASGIPGVQNYSQAMGALNSIVGAGDMQMQDLANALGTGVLAVVKGYGLTLNDVGAALATFGDNNIRGAGAATDLRMAVQALAVPAKNGQLQLQAWGLSADSLSEDMQSHGLVWTLNALHDLFVKNGVTATEQGAVITDMFGKKAGSGLAVLMGQLDRVNSKVPDIAKGASGFTDAWQTTSHTVGQEFADLKAGLESLAIKLGTALLPALSKVLGWVRDGVAWITQHKTAVAVLASVIGGVLVAALWGVVGALSAMEINPVMLGITALAAAAIYAWTHFKAFRTAVADVASFLKTVLVGAFHIAQMAVAALVSWVKGHSKEFSAAWSATVHEVEGWAKWFDKNVLSWIRARIADLVGWWKDHSAEISTVWQHVWTLISTAVKVAWDAEIKPLLTNLMSTWRVVWGVVRDTAKLAWSIISGVITTAMHLIMNIIGVALDLLTGHWGKAWQDVKKLVSQGLGDIVHLIVSVASGFGTLLYDAGANIIKGLINGVKSMAGGIKNAIGDVAHTIRSFLPFSPAKQGPLSGSGSPDIAGRKIGEMVASGISGSVAGVSRATRGLAGAASLALGGQGLSGLALTASAAAGSGSAGEYPPIIVQVDGRQLFKILQVQALQNGRRNQTTGLVYT